MKKFSLRFAVKNEHHMDSEWRVKATEPQEGDAGDRARQGKVSC